MMKVEISYLINLYSNNIVKSLNGRTFRSFDDIKNTAKENNVSNNDVTGELFIHWNNPTNRTSGSIAGTKTYKGLSAVENMLRTGEPFARKWQADIDKEAQGIIKKKADAEQALSRLDKSFTYGLNAAVKKKKVEASTLNYAQQQVRLCVQTLSAIDRSLSFPAKADAVISALEKFKNLVPQEAAKALGFGSPVTSALNAYKKTVAAAIDNLTLDLNGWFTKNIQSQGFKKSR